jgi:hypothetical protein
MRIRRLNLSFVLHEASTSAAVADAALASDDRYGLRRGPAPDQTPKNQIVGLDKLSQLAPDVVLTAQIGLPAVLGACAARLPHPPAIVAIDAPGTPTVMRSFFRAPARLELPAWQAQRVAVAAAVVRPGGASIELVCVGTFAWPAGESDALRALERLILAHVDQWRPPRALWDAPAEACLPELRPGFG